jgi:hypothetical protein
MTAAHSLFGKEPAMPLVRPRTKRSLQVGTWAAFVGLGLGASACEPSNKIPEGPPLVTEVLAFDPTAGPEILNGLVPILTDGPVYPLSPVVIIFDRLLDATALVDLDPDGGPETKPKMGIATIDSTPGGALEAEAAYTPNGHHRLALFQPKGPNLRVIVASGAGLPAAATVTVSLRAMAVRSHDRNNTFIVQPPSVDGGAWGGQTDAGAGGELVPVVTFQTQPIMASFTVPPADPMAAGAMPTEPAKVTFNVTTGDDAGTHIQATATVAGAPVAVTATVARDEMDPLSWNVSPPTAGWPAGATVTITVDAGLTDTYGVMMGAAANATFVVQS